MEKIKWSEKLTYEPVLKHIGEKRTLSYDFLHRKVNSIGHILRRNCLLHNAIEGQMTEMKGIIIILIIRLLLDDLRSIRRYWELKEEADDLKTLKREFIN